MTLNISWNDLDYQLHDSLKEILTQDLEFDKVMPVQKSVIPIFSKNYDVAVEAATGSGKTLAFLLPILENLVRGTKSESEEAEDLEVKEIVELGLVHTLIISPTRELAIQIYDVLAEFQKKLEFFGVCCYFGGKKKMEMKQGDVSNIVVATPGRISDILQTGIDDRENKFKNLRYLVLDEADRLLDSNFQQSVKEIVLKLPKQRRTGLFSATLTSKKIEDLIKVGLRNPAVIKLSKKGENQHEIPDNLKNSYVINKGRQEKIFRLMKLIHKNRDKKIIVFFNTCASVGFYYRLIKTYVDERPMIYGKMSIMQINGNMKQTKRITNYNKFNESGSGVMFATDVIARGIDFPEVDLIIQIDVPQDPNFYIHRIGRTARKGLFGHAILLLMKSEMGYIEYLKIKDIQIDKLAEEDIEGLKIKDFNKFIKKSRKLMLTDKDFIIKGSKAFVSFMRSYKEHKLATIFKVNELDFPEIARSFFLFKIPFIKEFKETSALDKKISTDHELALLEKIEFKNKNQEKMIKEKIKNDRDQKLKKLAKRKMLKKKAQKEQGKRKVRSFAERKRAKERQLTKEITELNKEKKLERKLKKGKITQEEYDQQMGELYKKYEYPVH